VSCLETALKQFLCLGLAVEVVIATLVKKVDSVIHIHCLEQLLSHNLVSVLFAYCF